MTTSEYFILTMRDDREPAENDQATLDRTAFIYSTYL